MTKYITVISGKGGTGKTTTSLNLATALAKHGKEVILLDANVTTPNVNIHLGMPKFEKTLHDALKGEIDITEAIHEHETGIKIIPASLSLEALRHLNLDDFIRVLKDLDKKAEYIIIDTAAGLGRETITAIEAADEVIIVTNPEMPAATDALKAMRVARDVGKTILGVVLNKVKGDRHELKQKEIQELLEYPIIAVIPEDKEVRKSIKKASPVTHSNPKSKAAKEFMHLGKKMLDETEELAVKSKGFIRRLLGI